MRNGSSLLIDRDKMNEITYLSAIAVIEILVEELDELLERGKILEEDRGQYVRYLSVIMLKTIMVYEWKVHKKLEGSFDPKNFDSFLDDIYQVKKGVLEFIVKNKFEPAYLKNQE